MPGQSNNVYIFPGVGLGVLASASRIVTDEMFRVAARIVADWVLQEDLEMGRVYPSLKRIRAVSYDIAVAVAETAWKRGLAGSDRPDDVPAYVTSLMFEPDYPRYA